MAMSVKYYFDNQQLQVCTKAPCQKGFGMNIENFEQQKLYFVYNKIGCLATTTTIEVQVTVTR